MPSSPALRENTSVTRRADTHSNIHCHVLSTLPQALIDALTKGHLSIYVNEVNRAYGGAPIHSIVRRPRNHQYAADLLTALLTYSRADVNLPDSDGKPPLHIAVEVSSV